MKKLIAAMLLLLCLSLAACSPGLAEDEPEPEPELAAEPETEAEPVPSDAATDSILYENHKFGFALRFPASWEGKYSVSDLVNFYDDGMIYSVEIVHTTTREELGYAGWLCSVSRVTGEHFTPEEPPIMAGQTIILAQTGGYTYFVNFPSGVEYNEEPGSASAAEYQQMYAQIYDFVIGSFYLLEPDEAVDGLLADTILYENRDIGFAIRLPASWAGRYRIDEFGYELEGGGSLDGIEVIHLPTFEELGYVGELFAIARITDERYVQVEQGAPSFMLAQAGEYIYYLSFSHGVQWNLDPDSETAADYFAMLRQVHDFVKGTFQLLDD